MNNTDSVLEFLQTRRSTPPALLGAPYPSEKEIRAIAAMGLRVPDHKKVEPWRLIALTGESLEGFSREVKRLASKYEPAPEKQVKINALYENAGAVLVMVYSPHPKEGAPEWEQFLSMGAVGVSLVNASIAYGYGAAWMTGFLPDAPEIRDYLGVQSSEKLAGFIHMGTATSAPPERPRPNLDEKLRFL